MMPGMESTEQSRFDLAFSFITAALAGEDDGGPEIFSDLLIGLTGEQAEETIVVLATGFVCLLDELAQMHDVPVAAVWQAFVAQAQQALMEGLG
jgi:hypothetical protein